MVAISLQSDLLSGAAEIPSVKAPDAQALIGVAQAREELGSVIESVFSSALNAYERRQMHWIEVGGVLSKYERQERASLVRVTVGTGKTRQTVKQIVRALQENKYFRVLIRVKDHKMGRELAADLSEAMSAAGLNPKAELAVWHGTDAPDPRPTAEEGDQACKNQERLKEVIEAGGGVSDACNACGGCPFKPDPSGNLNLGCYYRQQYAKESRVVIAAGDVSIENLPNSLRKPKPTKEERAIAKMMGGKLLRHMDFDLIILDETNPTDLISGQSWIKADCLVTDLGLMHKNATGRTVELGVDTKKKLDHSSMPRILRHVHTIIHDCAEAGEPVTAGHFKKIFMKAEELRAAIRYARKHKVDINSDELKALLAPDELSAMLAKAAPVNNLISNIVRILKALIQGLEDAEKTRKTDAPIPQISCYFKPIKGERHLVCVPRRRMDISPHLKTAPILILDATADEQLLRPWFPTLDLVADIKVEDGAGVYRVQLTDRAMSYRELKPKTWEKGEEPSEAQIKEWRAKYRNGGQSADTPAEKEDLRLLNKHDSIRAAEQKVKDVAALQNFMRAVYGGRVGIVAPKGIVPMLKRLGVDSDDIMNFGACRGQNRFEKVRGLIVAGRPSPPVADCENLAAIIFGQDVKRLDGPFERRAGAIFKRSGVRSMPNVEFHPDERVEAVRRSICEAELIQAVGRARAVNRGSGDPVTIVILTSVPLDVPVDQFMNYDCIDSIVGWPGACVAAGMWPKQGVYGANSLRAEMIRATAEAMPGYGAAMALGDITDSQLRQHVKDTLRKDVFKDQIRVIDDEFGAGGGVDFFGLPLSAERFEHGEAQTLDMRSPCAAMYAGKPEAFQGSGIEGNGWSWEKIELDSASWTPKSRTVEKLIEEYTNSYPTVRDEPESNSESNSPDRAEPLVELMAERGFIPLNTSHLMALGVYASKGAASKALKDVEPAEGEVEVAYKWGAGRQKTKGRAIVRADSLEAAREILLDQLPGCQLI
jgi:hypothetical protein